MKKINIAILIMLVAMTTACGTFKKTASVPESTTTTPTSVTDPCSAIIATLGNWQTLQAGGNINLNAGSNFSSSIQVRMIRDQAIYISLRPLLGIEVGKLIITADSLYAVDKVHKRYIAEKVSILTSGIPVTVSDVQDIFLGRPCIIGKGTLNEENKSEMTVTQQGNTVVIAPSEHYKGYGYTFTFNKNNRITSLDIVPAGSSTAAYQAKYSDVRNTAAGNIAHNINANATIEKKQVALSLSFKDIEWNGKVKMDMGIPGSYKRMSARDLFSMFAN